MSPLTEAQRLQRTERFIAYIRAAVVSLNTVTYLWLAEHGDRHEMALALIGIVWIYTIVTLVAKPGYEGRIRGFAVANTILDNVFIALWLWATGGADSPYYVLYYAETVATVGRFGVRLGLIAAVGSALLYAAVVVLDGGGSFFVTTVRIGYIFILVAFVGHVVEAARRSEREAAEAEAEAVAEREAGDLKDRFIATVSHELRTPLTAVRGAASTLLKHEDVFDIEQRRDLLTVIERQSRRLGTMIQDLLDFSMLQQGRMRLQVEDVELVGAVQRVVDELQQRGTHRVVFSAAHRPIWVECDPIKVGRAVAQVADNAMKFSAEGSVITFDVRSVDDGVEIEVEDEGIGLAPDQLERIFDRFYQVDASLTRVAEGSGIGLSMARELIKLHGGDISVRAQAGEGSTFVISLPLRAVGGDVVRDLRSA